MQSKWGGTKWGPKQRVSVALLFGPHPGKQKGDKETLCLGPATAYCMPLMYVESDVLVITSSVSAAVTSTSQSESDALIFAPSVMRTSSRFSSTIPQSDAMGMCMVFYLFSCLLVFALDTDDRGPDEGGTYTPYLGVPFLLKSHLDARQEGTHAYAMFFSFSHIIFSRRGYIRPFVMIQNHS
jgi:hypothetical protein